MHVQCPHCRNPIEVVEETSLDDVACPSCGSSFSVLGPEATVSFKHESKQLGHFTLTEMIGAGAFGTVWKAHDDQLDRTVAVKVPRKGQLDKEETEKFFREARAAAQLRHPNIVSVHEVGRHDETVYIVSDFVDGVSLAEWLTAHQPTPRVAAELCEKIAFALHHAHEKGIVHRDIKPGNVMIDREDVPSIMDFGLAKRDAGEITITLDGQVLGTPAYMSPEQACGKAYEADARSDVYSLGVILYEMLAGQRPFLGKKRMLIVQIAEDSPPPIRKSVTSVPRDLETICLKCLEKNPERRYATAKELAADLRRWLNNEPIHARRSHMLERSWRWCKRHPAVTALASCVVLLAALLCCLLLLRPSDGSRTPPLATQSVVVGLSLTGPDLPSSTSAEWAFVPLEDVTRLPLIDEIVHFKGENTARVDLKPGNYLVVVRVRGFGFHEVFRYVPDDPESTPGSLNHTRWQVSAAGVVEMPKITLQRTESCIGNMIFVEGGEFIMGAGLDAMSPAHERKVASFYLDATEVTFADVQRVFGEQGLRYPDDMHEDHPATVHWGIAVAYAEAVGKRLMSEAEYEFAATNGGVTRFPWGDDSSKIEWTYGPVGTPNFDISKRGIRGLFSNVAEWTDSVRNEYPGGKPVFEQLRMENSASRAVRGGPDESPINPGESQVWTNGGPCVRQARHAHYRSETIGFRCARSYRPRFLRDE